MSGTKSTYNLVTTKGTRGFSRSTTKELKTLLDHLNDKPSFHDLRKKDLQYDRLIQTFTFWTHSPEQPFETLYSIVNAGTINEHMPSIPTSMYEVLQAMFNTNVRIHILGTSIQENENDITVAVFSDPPLEPFPPTIQDSLSLDKPVITETENPPVETVIPDTTNQPDTENPINEHDKNVPSKDKHDKKNAQKAIPNSTDAIDVQELIPEDVVAITTVIPAPTFTTVDKGDKHASKQKSYQKPPEANVSDNNPWKLLVPEENGESLSESPPDDFSQPSAPAPTTKYPHTNYHEEEDISYTSEEIDVIEANVRLGKSDLHSVPDLIAYINSEKATVSNMIQKEKTQAKHKLQQVSDSKMAKFRNLVDKMEKQYIQFVIDRSANATTMIDDKCNIFRTYLAEGESFYTRMQQLQSLLEGTNANIESDYIKTLTTHMSTVVEKNIYNKVLQAEQDIGSMTDKRMEKYVLKSEIDKIDTSDFVLKTEYEAPMDAYVTKSDFDTYRSNLADALKQIATRDEEITEDLQSFEHDHIQVGKHQTMLSDIEAQIERLQKDVDVLKQQIGSKSTTQNPKLASRWKNVDISSIQKNDFGDLNTDYSTAPTQSLVHGTQVSYRTPIMTKGQTAYILEQLKDEDGNNFYSACTAHGTTINLYDKHIIDVNSAQTKKDYQTESASVTIQSDDHFDDYQQTSTDNQQRSSRGSILREEEYMENIGSDRTVKRVREQDLNSIKVFPKDLVTLSKKNAEKFYSRLRLYIHPYNIPLTDWHQLTSIDQVLDLNPTTTKNLKPARKVMARALYKLLDCFQDDLFDDTTHFKHILPNYEATMDGFEFLKQILLLRHPSINKNAQHTTSICETLKAPTYSPNDGLFPFLKDCDTYFKNNEKSPLFQTKFVKESLETDRRFHDVIKTLSDRMRPYVQADTGFIEPSIMLKNLPTFFSANMHEDELLAVGPSTGICINAIDDTQINAVTRSRSTRPPPNSTRKQYRKPAIDDASDDEGERQVETPSPRRGTKGNTYCDACGTYGHLDEKCPLAGKVLHIQEWVKQLDPKQRKIFLHDYKKNRIMTHQKYLESKRSRKHLKMRINAIEVEHESHIPMPAPSILHAAVTRAIDDAHAKNPDIDFGSMDLKYKDFKEPEIDMETFHEDIDLDLE